LLNGEEESWYRLFAGVLINSPKIEIWRVIVDLRLSHSINELTFHPRIAGVVQYSASGAMIPVKSSVMQIFQKNIQNM
jgi:hypothetical protein